MCEQKQMSRYRLAQKSGISQSSISTLLNRQSVPTIQTLEKICKGLDMTLAQFFSEDDELPNLTEEQKRLLTTWNAMNEQEKALVEAYMQGIVRK
ncbi:helix-turn-helix domain-containing protein [Clostridium fessum]|uniref:helix-turn-helix domain-containing protein n=1 Tax=Clostridium fessum TaxID=2126740 RepID=UPI0022E3C9DA|nr:helix-turn-helix transcriptional regulator [Clostridium fessum]